MQQLKNSGGLRLIQKQAVIDSIIAYDGMVSRQQFQDGIEQRFLERCRDNIGEMLNAGVLYQSINLSTNEVIRPAGNPRLITDNPGTINKMTTDVIGNRNAEKFSADMALQLKQNATWLINYLTKEYQPE